MEFYYLYTYVFLFTHAIYQILDFVRMGIFSFLIEITPLEIWWLRTGWKKIQEIFLSIVWIMLSQFHRKIHTIANRDSNKTESRETPKTKVNCK